MSNFSANIKAILDTSGIPGQLDEIGKKYHLEIKTSKLDMSGIKSQMKDAGVTAGKEFASGFNNSLASINTTSNNAANTIRHMQRTLAGMKFDRSSINLVTKDLEEMKLAISNVTTRINGNNLNISIRGIDELGRAVTIVKQFDYQSGRISTVGKTIAQSFDTGADAAKRFEKEVNSAYSELLNKQKQMGALQLKLEGLDKSDTSQIATIKSQIGSLKAEYDELKAVFGEHFTPIQTEGLTAGFQAIENKMDILKSKAVDTGAKMASAISDKVSNGSIETSIAKVTQQYQALNNTISNIGTGTATESLHSKLETVRNDLVTLNNLQTRMNSGISGEKLVSVYERYNQTLTKVKNNLSTVHSEVKQITAATPKMASGLDASKLSTEMSTWLSKNSRAAKDFGGAIQNLNKKLDMLSSTGKLTESELKNIKNEFSEIKTQAAAAGKTGATFGATFKNAFESITRYVGVSTVIYKSIEALKQMFDNVVKIDSAMTELKKVTNETSAAYNKFLSNSGSVAKEIGTTIDGLVESTADFARLGYSFEDSQELAKVANIYAVVGDEVESVDVATKSIISTLAAYKDEITDTMQIVDKFNEVGNNFAISSGGIGDALQRSASALAAANNTLDQSIALITAANTVVQDPESVGTAFKTVAMRIRSAKTELEAAGLETDGMAESTAELRKEILALSGVDIMLDENTFKSTYDIMDELAEKWQDLTDVEQATITELIAGKRQGNVISSLLNNFDIARDVLETSETSSGSATKEHEKYMESLEAKLNQLQAAWQEFSQVFMDDSFLKGFVDAGTGILTVLTDIIDTLGVIPTLVATVVAVLSFKKIGKDEMFSFSVNMPMVICFH